MTLILEQSGALRSIGAKPATTTRTVVYTAPVDSRPYFLVGNVANLSAATITATLEWFSAKDAVYYPIGFNVSVPIGGVYNADDIPVAMLGGDQICITISAANAASVTLAIMERPGRQQ